jgi:hypothetical protein
MSYPSRHYATLKNEREGVLAQACALDNRTGKEIRGGGGGGERRVPVPVTFGCDHAIVLVFKMKRVSK